MTSNMLRGKPLCRLSLTVSSPSIFQLFSSSVGLFSNLPSFLKHCCDHIALLLKYLNDPHWENFHFLLAKIKMVYCKFGNICGIKPSNSKSLIIHASHTCLGPEGAPHQPRPVPQEGWSWLHCDPQPLTGHSLINCDTQNPGSSVRTPMTLQKNSAPLLSNEFRDKYSNFQS